MIERQPEPELMDSLAQVDAYASADFVASDQAFVERLLARLQPLPDSGALLDLGCGPASISIHAARLMPGWEITALDAGPNMLAQARRNLAQAPAALRARVHLQQAHLPAHALTQRFAVIISNSLLHHLPDPAVLWQSVRELADAGAMLQIMDLFRPHSAQQLEQLVATYAGDAPDLLQQDFRNSLRAAYTVAEIREQLLAAGLGHLQVATISDRHVEISGRR